MDSTKSHPSDEPKTTQNITIITSTAENGRLLAFPDRFSPPGILESFIYVNIPMSRYSTQDSPLICFDDSPEFAKITTTTFDDLPNKLLSLILHDGSIALQNRIQLRAVSSRWLGVIEEKLKKTSSLVLRDTESKEFNALVVLNSKYFNAKLFNLLGRLFPTVSELSVNINCTDFYRNLPELISQFTATLKSFSLTGSYQFKDIDYFPRAPPHICIAAAINRLTSLTSLQLSVPDLNFRMIVYLVPTYPRLHRFTLDDGDTDGRPETIPPPGRTIFEFLTNSCTHLKLNSNDLVWSYTKVDASLTSLHLVSVEEEELRRITKKFSSLESLTIDSFIILSTPLLQTLSRLVFLTELRLSNLYYTDDAIKLPLKKQNPALYSIKRLHLGSLVIPEREGKFFCKILTACFPCLKQINMIFEGISDRKEVEKNLGEFSNSVNVQLK